MKILLTTIFLGLILFSAKSQRFVSTESSVHFFSGAILEDIEADNSKSTSIIDISTGDFAFTVPIKEFQFDKSLMQEHFNENYLESDKYPKSTFVGKIKDWNGQKGTQKVIAAGKLNIHGVTKDVEIEGDISYNGKDINVKSVFMVVLKEYKIKIPKIVFQNIAEEIKVTVDYTYKIYNEN